MSFNVNDILRIGNTINRYIVTVLYGSIPESTLLSRRVYPRPAVTTP
jgi:hypothetical protein